jgi:radical SAM superfamily enzyme YgiQ (UPF0313 family)
MPREKNKKRELKILLIIPKYADILNFNNKLENINYNYTFPLGLGYISSAMKKAGYPVTVLNLNHEKGTIHDLIHKHLDKEKYDIVATGHTGMGFSVVQKIVNSARVHSSNPKIILGGALITSEKELMFKTLNPDYAVYGEGEVSVVNLLKCIESNGDLSKVKGIMFYDADKKIIMTPPENAIKNIDKIPFPDFEALGFSDYLDNQFTNTGYYQNYYDFPRPLPILASRSCPFQCTFCYHSIGRGYRERSMKNFIKEIKSMIKKYNINIICIYDDLFSAKKQRILDFCNEINKLNEKLPQKIKWTCQLSVSTVDDELLKIMKNAGCETISYGFESFSEDVLKSMNKPITPEQIDFALKTTLKHNIGVQANFIFGDPAETIETSRKTLEYWKENCKGQVNLGFIQPYPGSKIYERCFSKGIIKDKLDYIQNEMTTDAVINMTDSMTDKDIHDLEKEIKKLKSRYYNFIVPKSVTRQNKGYEVAVKCPFCSNTVTYGNYFLQNKFIYASIGLVCRNCNMRFNIVSPLVNLMKKTFLLPVIEKIYYRVKKFRYNAIK